MLGERDGEAESTSKRRPTWPRPTSSTPSARPSGAGAVASRRCTPPISGPTRSRPSSSAPASTPAPSTTWSSATSTPSVRRPATSPAPAGSSPASPSTSRAPPSTASAAPPSRPSTSRRRRVMTGTQDLVVAGGVQNMSQIPIMSAMVAGQKFGHETPFASSPGWQARYGDQEVSQFRGAEMIAEKWDISRDDMEEFAVESHERALQAPRRGSLRARDRAPRRAAPSTKARGSPTGRRSARCPRWSRAAGSPPRCRARSPTRRRPCSSPASRRSRITA